MAVHFDEEEAHLFFENGAEEHVVRLIKKKLRTPEQKRWLDQEDISIEDMLNGRVAGGEVRKEKIREIFRAWNRELGRDHFLVY